MSAVKRFVAEGASREWSAGPWVRVADYLALQAALREALHEWKSWNDDQMQGSRGWITPGDEADKRITELRAKFIDEGTT